ncbi:MAG: HEAT repeat domain-containing protein [Myxococcota bacterium]
MSRPSSRTWVAAERTLLWLLAVTAWESGCQREPPPSPVLAQAPAAAQNPQRDAELRKQALGRDPEAMDEALRAGLENLRDRFKCNDVSGCPAEAVLVGFGWHATPALQNAFLRAPRQAPYRARTVRIIAESKDPLALPFLRQALTDRDPEVTGHAIFGLGLLEARNQIDRLHQITSAVPTVWGSAPQLSAWWVLHHFGEPGAAAQFVERLKWLSSQQMGGPALAWGVSLCRKPGAPDCGEVLPLIARHAHYGARRAAAEAMAAAPRASDAATLVDLTGDPVPSIARAAEQGLRQLTGKALQGPDAWRKWCEEAKCTSVATERRP